MKRQYKRKVLIWLIIGGILVAAMVIIGGITRLTHSGLSMVEWKPLTGILPPVNAEEWAREFDNYKQYPEYQKLNHAFTLQDFKGIYWWEYIHRILGRVLGIVFIVPFVFFIIKGVFDRPWKKKLLLLFLLGGFQGFLGWFMVKSGLIEMPAVSHYRLAAHLISAFGLFCYIWWLILSILKPERITVEKRVMNWAKMLLALVIIQIIYGAFVAGLKAGFFYNSYPLMGGNFVSDVIPVAYSKDGLMSFIQEPVTVQFFHRHIPLLMLVPIFMMWRITISAQLKKAVYMILGIWIFQFLLGVLTLVYAVPLLLGVLHQLGALLLLSAIVYLFYRMVSVRGHIKR